MVIGNLLVAQSGGPTAVVNSSLYGILKEANKFPEIGKVYGAINGIEGAINNNIIDCEDLGIDIIESLKHTPGAFLGSCRYKLSRKLGEKKIEIEKIYNCVKKNDIRYFIYIGGNDSMDTADKINKLFNETSYKLKVIGVPKTVDNDLVLTHHSPGYGSAAKFIATVVKEAGLHTASMKTSEPVTILETVGRNTGWLPASSALARKEQDEAPHMICFPEIPFISDKFLSMLEEKHKDIGGLLIVVGEGLKDERGLYLNQQADNIATDDFGHPLLGGISSFLKNIIEENLNLKTRFIKLDICQQAAMHLASARDLKDAILVGRKAVRSVIAEETGKMVILLEKKYKKGETTGLVSLNKVANKEKKVPMKWIDRDNFYVKGSILEYISPLIQGEVSVPMEKGLPKYCNRFI